MTNAERITARQLLENSYPRFILPKSCIRYIQEGAPEAPPLARAILLAWGYKSMACDCCGKHVYWGAPPAGYAVPSLGVKVICRTCASKVA